MPANSAAIAPLSPHDRSCNGAPSNHRETANDRALHRRGAWSSRSPHPARARPLRRLRALDIPYTVTPGLPSFSAAAAALGAELTLPGLAQSVVLTRMAGRASAMPEGEKLTAFAATGAVLAVHLSVHMLGQLIAELTPHYGRDCPVAIVWRASWPDQRIIRATLGTLDAAVGPELERTAIIFVGRTLGSEDFDESRLYAADYDRRYRPTGPAPRFPEKS